MQPAICWNVRVSRITHRSVRRDGYGSDNMSGADNQQERLRTAGWIVGFVDGEGCFSVPIQRNEATTLGWQVQPQFVVVQAASSVKVRSRCFGTTSTVARSRATQEQTTHRESQYRYVVRRFADLDGVIVPFFKEFRLLSSKRENFEKFVSVLELMKRRRHLEMSGLVEIATIVETMNRRAPAVSRILRGHTPAASSEAKIWSVPYGDVGRQPRLPA